MRLYRLLLRLYPAAFRAEYGDEMCAVFAAGRRDHNALLFWYGALLDVFGNAIRLHTDLLRQDLHWTVRVLRKSPSFTLTAVLVAALGTGATTAAFALANHVLLRPLAFAAPEQLVTLFETERDGRPQATTPPGFDDWRTMSRSFSAMGAYIGILIPMNLSGHGEPSRPNVVALTAGVFQTLGINPLVGRVFTGDDERDDSPRVTVLSLSLANAMFGEAAAAVGQTIRLDSRPYQIVGVMPASFAFPSPEADLWIPRRSWGTSRSNHMLAAIARLRPGISLTQARADMAVVASQLARAYPTENAGRGVGVVDLRDRISPQSRTLILAVLGAAICLTLIGCTNLASLLFARATARRHEIAVRVAIGAGRERLVRQLLTESALLAAAGGAVGLLWAVIAAPSLASLVPEGLPIASTPEIDWRVFTFTTALTLGTIVTFGAGPAMRLSRSAGLNALRARSSTVGVVGRLRMMLVVGEMVGTVVLLVAAGLLLKAMWRVQEVDTGFRAESVLTAKTVLPMTLPASARADFYSRVLTRMRALPGVTSAAYISFVPMTFAAGNFPVTTPGVTLENPNAHTRFITPDYFRTLGIPLLSGRDLTERDDRSSSPRVTIIGHSLAKRLWPGEDAIGRRLTFAGVDWEVAGVAGDVAVRGLEQPAIPQAYFPAGRVPPGLEFYAPKDLVVRTKGEPAALVASLRAVVHEINPEQAVSDIRPLDEIVESQTTPRRVQVTVLGSFALLAFMLAAIGVYGLLSFAVSTRTREVGVRMALGASRREVLTMFLRQGLVLGLVGVGIGVLLAYAAGRGMTALLFGVAPGDPAVYLIAVVLALFMTIAGSLRPAFTAACVDPVITMQSD
jgi:predicted permease